MSLPVKVRPYAIGLAVIGGVALFVVADPLVKGVLLLGGVLGGYLLYARSRG